MGCKCAKISDEYCGWECTISGDQCMYMPPNSKRCAEEYGEGPDAKKDKCEDCKKFYLENNKRCCKDEPLSFDGENIKPSKYIEDDVFCCGAFEDKNK